MIIMQQVRSKQTCELLLTFFHDQVPHHQHGCVTRIDVVAAIDLLAIDAEAEAGENFEGSIGHDAHCQVAHLGVTVVLWIGLGQGCHPHGDGSVEVEHTHYHKDPPGHDPAMLVAKYHKTSSHCLELDEVFGAKQGPFLIRYPVQDL